MILILSFCSLGASPQDGAGFLVGRGLPSDRNPDFYHSMYEMPFLLRFLATAMGLGVAVWSFSTILFSGFGVFLLTAFVLSLFNLILKPILVLLVLPLVVLTFGLGLWVVNAGLVALTAQFIPGFIIGGWGGAFWTALWISFFTIIFLVVSGRGKAQFQQVGQQGAGFRKQKKDDDDVIDI